MTRNILMGVGVAAVLTVGLVARSQDPKKSDPMAMTQSDLRKVTVQGCLERDYLYTPSGAVTATTGATGATGTTSSTMARTAATMAPTPFKLTQVEIIKDEPVSSSYGTSPAMSAAGAESKDLALHVAAATDKKVDLDGQVNHKVELVGMMSNKDVMAARGQTTAAAGGTEVKIPGMMFKATSVKSLSDKCQ